MKTRISLLALICLTATAHAGWTVKVLHPAGATSSQAYCTDGVTVGGQVDGRAAIWNITSGAVTYLTAGEGRVNAVQGGRQAGKRRVNSLDSIATAWQGSAGSEFDLTAGEPHGGEVTCMAGGKLGGSVVSFVESAQAYTMQATLWNSLSNSFVRLDPGVGNGGSTVTGITDSTQVGWVTSADRLKLHASLWRGTKASFVDLHPDGVDGDSEALACVDGVQVGYAGNRAALWRGTKESFVDLTPAGAITAKLRSTLGDIHLGGYAFSGTVGTGCALWREKQSAPEDIVPYLPSFYVAGRGDGLARIGSSLTVAGSAFDSTFDLQHAVVWQYTAVPEPGSIVTLSISVLGFSRYNRRR